MQKKNSKNSLKEMRELAELAHNARVQLARDYFPEFACYVLKNEMTGEPIEPAEVHRWWGQLLKKHDRIAILAQVELGKSQQLVVAYLLWRIGHNPRLRAAIISSSEGGGIKLIRSIKAYIEKSKEYKEVFPHIRKGDIWQSTGFTVELNGADVPKDPNVRAYGLDSSSINGSRLDLVIGDDIDNRKSTNTAHNRAETYAFFTEMAMSRISEHGQAIVIGNAWHRDDLIHQLKRDGWNYFICPAIVTQEVHDQWPGCPLPIGGPLWPEWWPMSRLMKKKAELRKRDWDRQMMCKPYSEATSLFSDRDIEHAKARGDGVRRVGSIDELLIESGFTPKEQVTEKLLMDADLKMQYSLPYTEANVESLPEFRIYHGLDLSTGRSNDQSAIVTVATYSDGTRRLLNVQKGHWQGMEIFQRVQETYKNYGGAFCVESTGMQRQIFDLLRGGTMVPMYPYDTRSHNKMVGFGVISSEFTAKKWIIPSSDGRCDTDIEELLDGLYSFSPKSHCDDSAMALLFAVGLMRGAEENCQSDAGEINVTFVT